VLGLPKKKRPKALRYGLLGAYVFRGLALLFASMLISIWWFKPLGGLYLLYLALTYFFKKSKKEAESSAEDFIEKEKRSWLFQKTLGMLGPFWATVLMVEVMDMAFSIDNVVAANAYSKNIILVWTGVFIGILAMRFAAGAFVKLMERFPFLETCAYAVIAMLGLKLSLAGFTHFYPCHSFSIFLEGNAECLTHRGIALPEGEQPRVWGDIITSVLSFLLFVLPVLSSFLFNWPEMHQLETEEDSAFEENP
ncbi:MAG: DUF475 domain-containing protein, partial [Chitinophagaceae bacterium]